MKQDDISIFEFEQKSEKRVADIHDTPTWMIDNKFLLSGYRLNFNTISCNIKSLFMKHNELMNVWTHLIGAIIFIGLIIYLNNSFPKAPWSMNKVHLSFVDIIQNSDSWILDYQNKLLPQINKFEQNDYIIEKTSFKDVSSSIIKNLNHEIKIIEDKYINLLSSNNNQLFDNFKKNESYLKEDLKLFFQKYDYFQNNRGEMNDKSYADEKISIKISNNNIKTKFELLILQQKKLKKSLDLLSSRLEIYPIIIFAFTAFFCLMSSTIFHLFYPISKHIYKILHKLDLAGISILNFGSSFSMFYYYFYCMNTFNMIYSVSIFIACFTVFFVSLTEKIHLEENVKWKALMYAGLGLSNIVPISHLIFLSLKSSEDNDFIPVNMCIFLLFTMAALYLIGLAIYTTRFPERFFPRKFDIWMNSHTIWHVFVFMAAFTHFWNIIVLYQSRANKTCVKIH